VTSEVLDMTVERPLMSKGIGELEALFQSRGTEAKVLCQLLDELKHRTRPRATVLRTKVTKALGGKPCPPPERPSDDNSPEEPAEPPPDPFAVLGLPNTATLGEAREAYLRLVDQYHPDKVQGRGPRIVAIAHEETQKLNAAWAEVKKLRRG
jgi:DnaJ domain